MRNVVLHDQEFEFFFLSLKNCSLAIKVHGCRWFFWWHSLLVPLTFLHIIELNFFFSSFFSFFLLALKLSVGNIIFIPLDCNFYLHCSICILSEEMWRWRKKEEEKFYFLVLLSFEQALFKWMGLHRRGLVDVTSSFI